MTPYHDLELAYTRQMQMWIYPEGFVVNEYMYMEDKSKLCKSVTTK